MTDQEKALNQLLGQFKSIVMQLLNETADEFDAKIKDPEQREIYNAFTGRFGQKVLAIQVTPNN